jgi:hypothetical protein
MTDVQRTVSGIIYDSQYTIPSISNKPGIIVKAYADVEIAKIIYDVIPYKIETDNGNLVGYFTLQTNGNKATLLQMQLRSSFSIFNEYILILISDFIISNKWIYDILK